MVNRRRLIVKFRIPVSRIEPTDRVHVVIFETIHDLDTALSATNDRVLVNREITVVHRTIKPNELDNERGKSVRVPTERQFSRTVSDNFNEDQINSDALREPGVFQPSRGLKAVHLKVL